ncbi:MAG: phage tail tip lysozyme, partial [Muribaculaceae bacterium]|nr:phage tail tip lysozyme [Muribaculaceae bacterium]
MNINRQYITKINFTDKNSTARIQYIVIHYFGGLSTAKNLAAYWAREYAGASAHYVVGHEGEIFQIVEDDDVAWHCGTSGTYKHSACRNSNSIGIEMAVKKKDTGTLNATDKDWYFTPETVTAAVELTRQLMKIYNVPAENVIRHYDVTGKICPNPYYYNLSESTWQAFKEAIVAPDEGGAAEYKGATDTAQEKAVWDFLTGKGLNAYAAAGLMGNLYAESGFNSCNLQNSFNKKLGLSDMEYTARVDSGAYTNFVKDGAGYGLAQWTYCTRKQALFDYAKAGGYSVGNLNMQLEYLWHELTEYKKVMQALKGAESIKAASDAVLTGYEKPADQSEAAKNRRAGYGETIYNRYAAGQGSQKPTTDGAGKATQGENPA